MSSPAQLPTEILQALETFLGDDLQHADGDTGPLFGHIAMPPCRLPGVPQAIYDLFPVYCTDTSFIFVNFYGNLVAADNDLPVVNLAFDEFMNIFRDNLYPPKSAVQWRVPMSVDSWLEENVLPANAVVVIQLSPQISAGCALTLTGVFEWAFAEFPIERNIHVVTVSSPTGQGILFDLVSRHQENPSVPVCDIESLWTQDPTKDCHIYDSRSLEQIIEQLHDVIKEPHENSRLIISFDEGIGESLFRLLGDGEDEEDGCFERFRTSACDVPSFIYQLEQRAKPGRTVVVTVFGHLDHLPLMMDAFQELHLVLGRIDTGTPAWDNKSQQILAYPHWTSKQDRISQLWWAYQHEGVAVTVYSAKYTPKDFVKNGASHVRLVQGAHLGGYVVAALDLMSLGVGSQEIISLFVQDPLIVEGIKARLTFQSLIWSGGLNLNNTEARLFRDGLSKFNYDYRIAMLYALDCDPAVRCLKAKFIAILLNSGCCKFKNKGVTSQDAHNVFLTSRGRLFDLAVCGTTWATLGLVKHLCTAQRPSGNAHHLAPGIVRFHVASVNRAHDTYLRLLNIFEAHGLNPGTMPFEIAEDDLTMDDKLRFHTDLFLSHMHQVILCHSPTKRDDGNYDLEFKSLTSMQSCSFALGTDVLSLLFNPLRAAREMGHKGWYGISHKLSRSPASLNFHEWIVIPAEVVDLWSEETGLTPSDLASIVVPQTSNSIEVTEESSDMV